MPKTQVIKGPSDARNSHIENLVIELMLLIIERLPDVSTIFNLALTGPVLHKLITENEASIAERVVISKVGRRLMPVATALLELKALGDRLPKSFHEGRHIIYDAELMPPVVQILDRHIGPGRQTKWKEEGKLTTFKVAREYLAFDSVVDRWVQILATPFIEVVWMDRNRAYRGDAGGPPKLTWTEMLRFHKALYLVELVRTAFPWDLPAEGVDVEAYKRLCDQVAPWEMEQTRSLQLFILFQSPFSQEMAIMAKNAPRGYVRLRFMNWFLLTRDLTNLLAIYDKGKDKAQWSDEQGALLRYCMHFSRPFSGPEIKPRVFAFPKIAEANKFQINGQGRTNLDAGEIFAKYPEAERGARAWWYYRFLVLHGDLQIKYLNDYPFNKCEVCMLASGYTFGDFARLSMFAPEGGLAEPSDMLDWARPVSTSAFQKSLEGFSKQSLAYCKCPGRWADT